MSRFRTVYLAHLRDTAFPPSWKLGGQAQRTAGFWRLQQPGLMSS